MHINAHILVLMVMTVVHNYLFGFSNWLDIPLLVSIFREIERCAFVQKRL